MEIGKPNSTSQLTTPAVPVKESNVLSQLVEIAKKAQLVWKTTEEIKKMSIFQKATELLEEIKSKSR